MKDEGTRELNVERSLNTEHARASRQAKCDPSHGTDNPESLAHVLRESVGTCIKRR